MMKTLVLLLYLLRPDTQVVERVITVQITAPGYVLQAEEPRIGSLYWSTCDGWAQTELNKLMEQGIIPPRRRETMYRILECTNTI